MPRMPLIGKLSKPSSYKNITMKADSALHRQITEIVELLAPRGARILDLGSGEGALSLRLSDMGYKVLASDINEEGFKCHKSVEFVKLDFNNKDSIGSFSEMHKESFDIVLGIEIIEHLENPWDYIRFIKTFAKPGGFIIVSTPNITSWLSRLKFLFVGEFVSFSNTDYEISGHINPISEWELRRIFESEGMEALKIEPAGKLPLIVVGGSLRLYVISFLHVILRPFMRGSIKDGWCLLATARKGSSG